MLEQRTHIPFAGFRFFILILVSRLRPFVPHTHTHSQYAPVWYTQNMNTATATQTSKKHRTVSLDMNEVHTLYELSTRIADATEDVLEQEGAHAPSFLTALDRAKRDVAEGRVKHVDSLRDLM
jgi:hypothetical protein